MLPLLSSCSGFRFARGFPDATDLAEVQAAPRLRDARRAGLRGFLRHRRRTAGLAGIREYEQIQIYNVTNGERFTTYAIRAEAGSRIISVNGAAAHKAAPGDRVIICAYAAMDEAEADAFSPSLVYLDENNRVTRTGRRYSRPSGLTPLNPYPMAWPSGPEGPDPGLAEVSR